ncbi:MAG: hypothetical protein WC829_19125 [Hyphomicrobium sp.]|jgi:hypothetical protein
MHKCSHGRARPVFRAVFAGAVALTALAALGSAANAYSSRVNSACERDYYRFCAKYSIGTPELRSCMMGSRRSLSRRCVDALVAAGEVPKRYLTSMKR